MRRLSDCLPTTPTVPPASWFSSDWLILLLAVGTVLFGIGLTALPSASTSGLQATDVQANAQHSAPDHAVALITPLHLPTDADWPMLPGLTIANAVHAAPQTALLPDGADLDALGPPITVIRDGHAIRFRIASDALFAPAQATLTPAGLAALQPLAVILQRHAMPISVEGHADAIPIHNPRYPSNWELSASRAASVLRYLEQTGLAPERLHASGYAHTRPVADNDTADGRAINRRVEIVVTQPTPVQPSAEAPTTKRLIMRALAAPPSVARHALPPLQPPPPRPA